MKSKSTIISAGLMMTIILLSGQCYAQLTANAGGTQRFCETGLNNSYILGPDIVASGGTPPYTYTWQTVYVHPFGIYYASDFLIDTTESNPVLLNGDFDSTRFVLTVKDFTGATATDTAWVYNSIWGAHLGQWSQTIQQGETVNLNDCNVFSNFPIVQYRWRPSSWVADSTAAITTATPLTSIYYGIYATDANGCSKWGGPLFFITVLPVGVQNPEHSENPLIQQINNTIQCSFHEEGTFSLAIYSSNGALLYHKTGCQGQQKIDISNFSASWVMLVAEKNGRHYSQKLIIR